MKIESIQVGMPRTVEYRGRQVTTGIYKEAIPGPVHADKTGLDGDGQADLTVHGGLDKAVYAYSLDALPWWRKERPKDEFGGGSFGENLSMDHLDEKEICVGDTFEVGEAVLQASQPRFPCSKLSVKFNDVSILKQFNQLARMGVYFRVLQTGLLGVGDSFKLVSRETTLCPIAKLFSLYLAPNLETEQVGELLRINSLPAGLRKEFEVLLSNAR
jgi:MOSC domain-containing protein YiiM